MTANLPYPYSLADAEGWIGLHLDDWAAGTAVRYGVVLKESGQLMGCVALENRADGVAELGYWFGYSFWGQGFCTEAAQVVLQFGAASLGLTQVEARHLTANPASGRVLQKIGMVHVTTETIMHRGCEAEMDLYQIVFDD